MRRLWSSFSLTIGSRSGLTTASSSVPTSKSARLIWTTTSSAFSIPKRQGTSTYNQRKIPSCQTPNWAQARASTTNSSSSWTSRTTSMTERCSRLSASFRKSAASIMHYTSLCYSSILNSRTPSSSRLSFANSTGAKSRRSSEPLPRSSEKRCPVFHQNRVSTSQLSKITLHWGDR